MNIYVELQKAYSHTYVRIKKGNELLPFFVSTVNPDTGVIEGSILTSKDGKWMPHKVKYDEHTLEFELPILGYHNRKIDGKRGIVYLSRVPERQWRKGLTEKTLHRRSFPDQSSSFNSPEEIWELFRPQYNIRLEDLQDTDTAIALSPKVAIIRNGNKSSTSSNSSTLTVNYNNIVIGYIDNGIAVLFRPFSHLKLYVSKLLPSEVE
jgi:hypothetical protein